jgi:hypothetical protein
MALPLIGRQAVAVSHLIAFRTKILLENVILSEVLVEDQLQYCAIAYVRVYPSHCRAVELQQKGTRISLRRNIQ